MYQTIRSVMAATATAMIVLMNQPIAQKLVHLGRYCVMRHYQHMCIVRLPSVTATVIVMTVLMSLKTALKHPVKMERFCVIQHIYQTTDIVWTILSGVTAAVAVLTARMKPTVRHCVPEDRSSVTMVGAC